MIRVKDLLRVKTAYDHFFNTPMSRWQADVLGDMAERLFDALDEYSAAKNDMTNKFNEENNAIIKSERARLQAQGAAPEIIEDELQKLGVQRFNEHQALVKDLMEEDISLPPPIPLWKLFGLKISAVDLMAMKRIGVVK